MRGAYEIVYGRGVATVVFTPNLRRHVACPTETVDGVTVRAVLEAGHEVVSVPGPNAVTAALAGSGLPTDRFTFLGFPPRTSAKRLTWLGPERTNPGTVVLFESPRRVLDLLTDLLAAWGDRPCALAVNLSKLGERFVRGRLSEVHAALACEAEVRGELTLCVGGFEGEPESARWERADPAIAALVAAGCPPSVVRDVVASLVDLPRRAVYQRALGGHDGP